MSRVFAVQASFLGKVSLRGQPLATPQARATFSSYCRLSRKLGGHANRDKPLLSDLGGNACPVLLLELSTTSMREARGGERMVSKSDSVYPPLGGLELLPAC